MNVTCFECQSTIEADTAEGLGQALLAHARAEHEWPFPDMAIRNYGEATERLTGPSDRLPEIGEIEVHPVSAERIDDWLQLFDHDGFVGTPEWAACYCVGFHLPDNGAELSGHWSENRAASIERLRAGTTEGYLAYVDGRVAGWLNASRRCEFNDQHRTGGDDLADDQVICTACFVIAPPYRRHGVASALLDRAIADAPERGAQAVEAWPFHAADHATGDRDFRGPQSLYERRGFREVEHRERDVVVRRPT